MLRVSAPGKIILAGEHAVVYGKPALAAAVNKRLMVGIEKKKKLKISSSVPPGQVEEAIKKFKETYVKARDRRLRPTSSFEIKVESKIPVQVGMGSSAAVAVATVGGLLALVKKISQFSFADKELINKIAYQVEKKIHDNPSGVDNTISCFGGFLWFQKGKAFKRIKLKQLPKFILINTGSAKETTGEMVRKLKIKNEKLKTQIKNQKIFKKIEEQTKKMLIGLKENDRKIIMTAIRGCERGLEELGVVGEFAKKVVREIEKIGGVAKICGAGGVKERSGVLLCYHQEPARLFSLAKQFNLEIFEVRLGEEGVRIN